MAQFTAFAEGVEVNGETVLSVVNGMGPYKSMGLKILAAHGIKDPKPGEWYSQQAWLDSFKQISENIGRGTLLAIGKSIPDSAQWPPHVDSLEKALTSIDVAYHMNHRGGEIGYYRYESTGPRSGKMECRNPYPSDFDQGIIIATAMKFAPAGVSPLVKLDESASSRKQGADSCTFLIVW